MGSDKNKELFLSQVEQILEGVKQDRDKVRGGERGGREEGRGGGGEGGMGVRGEGGMGGGGERGGRDGGWG